MIDKSPSAPNLPAKAIVMTASLLFSGLLFLMLGMLFSGDFGMNRAVAYRTASCVAAAWIFGSAFQIARSPNYRTNKPLTEAVFHWWQGIVLALVMGFSFLQGFSGSPGVAWASAMIECVLVLFYLCYVGFAFLLRQRLALSSYGGLLIVTLSAAYAIWKAPK
jgi:hypothetical protein